MNIVPINLVDVKFFKNGEFMIDGLLVKMVLSVLEFKLGGESFENLNFGI